MASDFFAACEETVRRHDPDRYFAALFAPEAQRRHLFGLYAFYYELAHSVQVTREPMLAAIRLAWWRETVEMARAGKPREHDVARALTETLATYNLPQGLFNTMIAAWGESGPFADAASVEVYADSTVGALMRLGVRVMGGAETSVREAAIAYALAGRRDAAFQSIDANALARTYYAAARRQAMPKAALPVVMPAALVPFYLKRPDPPQWRKQIAYLGVALRGRL